MRMDQWSWKFFYNFPLHWYWSMDGSSQGFLCFHPKKREGVPEVGTKPLKTLRGHRASNRGSNRGSRGSNRGSKGSRKIPEALRGWGPCPGAPSPSINSRASQGELASSSPSQDDGKGGLSLRGVAVMTETAITATTAKTFKTVTVASLLSCIL